MQNYSTEILPLRWEPIIERCKGNSARICSQVQNSINSPNWPPFLLPMIHWEFCQIPGLINLAPGLIGDLIQDGGNGGNFKLLSFIGLWLNVIIQRYCRLRKIESRDETTTLLALKGFWCHSSCKYGIFTWRMAFFKHQGEVIQMVLPGGWDILSFCTIFSCFSSFPPSHKCCFSSQFFPVRVLRDPHPNDPLLHIILWDAKHAIARSITPMEFVKCSITSYSIPFVGKGALKGGGQGIWTSHQNGTCVRLIRVFIINNYDKSLFIDTCKKHCIIFFL